MACSAPRPATSRMQCMATGGVYLGGGIPPKIIDVFKDSTFIDAFNAKAPIDDLVKGMPVLIILNKHGGPHRRRGLRQPDVSAPTLSARRRIFDSSDCLDSSIDADTARLGTFSAGRARGGRPIGATRWSRPHAPRRASPARHTRRTLRLPGNQPLRRCDGVRPRGRSTLAARARDDVRLHVRRPPAAARRRGTCEGRVGRGGPRGRPDPRLPAGQHSRGRSRRQGSAADAAARSVARTSTRTGSRRWCCSSRRSTTRTATSGCA